MDNKTRVKRSIKMLVEIARNESFPRHYEINLGKIRGTLYSMALSRDEKKCLKIDLVPLIAVATERIYDLETGIDHVPPAFVEAIYKKVADIEALVSVFN